MSDTAMEFTADASNVLAAVKKMIDANKQTEKSLTSVAKAAEMAGKVAVAALNQQTASQQKQMQTIENLKNKIDELKEKNKQAGKAGMDAFAGMGTSIVNSVVGALKQAISLQIDFNKHLAEGARLQDETGRKLQVQALIKDKDFTKRVLPKIGAAANKAGVSLREAQEVAAELVSQGVDEGAATGGFLEEVLLGAQGTATTDKKGFATAISTFLKSRGKSLTAENARGVTQSVAALFAPTSLQGSDLQQIAQLGGLTKEFGVDEATTLAGFTTLKNTGGMDSEQSRTGLRNVLLRFAGDQPKETVDMLEKAGGKGVMDKFDMVGESFPQALQNFNELMQKLDEKSKNTVLSQMFGRENIAPAMTLLSNVPELMKNIALQGDKTILAKGVAIGTGGEAAQANRMANTEQLELMERQKQEFQKEMLVKAFELEARKMGTPELGVQAMSTGIRGLNSLGVDPKETIHNLMRTSGLALGASSQDQRNVGGFVDAMFNRAESFGEGSEITPMNVAGPQMPFVRQSTPFRGQKISIFDNEEADNLKDEKKDAALELAKARAEATSPDSPGGVKITQGEKEIIDSLRALVAATNIQTLELKKRTRNVDAGNE